MKKVLLSSICVLLFAGAALGQAGSIGLYFDNPAFSRDYFNDTSATLVPVYVVHKWTPGATAVQFMVQPGGGWNCICTGEIIRVPVSIGSSLGGLSAAYGRCSASDILITTINWFCTGTSPTCAYLKVVPDPAAPTGTIEVVNCSFVKLVGVGYAACVNRECYHCVVPTTETSWGQVKALYR